jgi:hypothetical protein
MHPHYSDTKSLLAACSNSSYNNGYYYQPCETNYLHHFTSLPLSLLYIIFLSLSTSLQNLTCQENEANFSAVCSDDFFLNGDLCRPKCSSWTMFSQSAETASVSVIGISTVIGIISTIIITTLSLVRVRNM